MKLIALGYGKRSLGVRVSDRGPSDLFWHEEGRL